MSNLVTIKTAAELINVHPNTIRNYIRDGRLSFVRVGPKLIRIRLDDLMEQLSA